MKKGRPSKMSGHVTDLSGLKFGKLIVIRFVESKGKLQKISYWFCKCDCGKEVVRSAKYLKWKPNQSCGCEYKNSIFKIFESKFEKTQGCWNWQGSLTENGYGKWKCASASRQSYIYYKGTVPKGLQVCHHCDNRKCVNPDHLFLADIAGNMRDKNLKNRQAKGSKIANSILTEEQVLEMREMRLNGKTYEQIAIKFGISWWLVRSVCKNRQWKHVPLGEECSRVKNPASKIKGSEMHTSILKEENIPEIRKLHMNGMMPKDICKLYNVNISTIYDIVNFRTWKHVKE